MNIIFITRYEQEKVQCEYTKIFSFLDGETQRKEKLVGKVFVPDSTSDVHNVFFARVSPKTSRLSVEVMEKTSVLCSYDDDEDKSNFLV